jgi:hypothetical protein
MIQTTICGVPQEIAVAIHHLLWVWKQYGGGAEDRRGVQCFPHQCFQAGEQATDYLVGLGLGIDQGWQFELNRNGVDIMNIGGEGLPYPVEGAR